MRRLLFFVAVVVLASCGRTNDNPWLGYVEGEDALISPPQPGWITHLVVQRGQWIRRGDLLFTLDDTHERAARDQAAANLAQAKAQLAQEEANHDYTHTELGRQNKLALVNAGTPTQYDSVRVCVWGTITVTVQGTVLVTGTTSQHVI